MAYVLPQVTVFQEFSVTTAAAAAPRSAHITGGHAKLFRYANSDEKQIINLGEYDDVADQAYAWPERPVGSQVDFGYVKLFAEDALLEYFSNAASVGSLVAPVAGYKNRVRDAGTSFKTNGSYARSASLLDRDVQIGDHAYVRGVVSGTEYVLNTSVRGFVGETVAASVGSASGASTNKTTQTLSVTVTSLGLVNAIRASADASSYDGRESGDITETYTIEVINSSVGGNHTTARLRVTSASGRDNQASITPSAKGVATSIGTRGLRVTFSELTGGAATSASSIAEEEGISPDDLVVGQKWRVVANQAFTAPTATAAGTYSGTSTTTYIVEMCGLCTGKITLVTTLCGL